MLTTKNAPQNTFTRPKGILTSADIGKFLQDNAGIAEVCSQTALISGTYNAWEVSIHSMPVAGVPAVFSIDFSDVPTVGDIFAFNSAENISLPYAESEWTGGADAYEVAANLATAWNSANPYDTNGNHYTALATGSNVTFTATGNGAIASNIFSFSGTTGTLTQTNGGTTASAFYFNAYPAAQKCVYGDNWAIGSDEAEVAANLAACWNLLSPAPEWQKTDTHSNPIGSPTPWTATVIGSAVTLTQTQIGDPGDPELRSDNFTGAWYALVNEGTDTIPPMSTYSFLGKLIAIMGINALIEVPPFYTAIAKGVISATAGDGNTNGQVAIVDGTHVEMRGQSPMIGGKALFDVLDGETVIFK